MTVSSLWTVLDGASCGKPVGAAEMMNPNSQTENLNPWNYNDKNVSSETQTRPALAVDLSIWICEALTSMAISNNNANPAVHLVYARTIKLLSLGLKLVFVVEGKRRIRRTEGDGFRKRRSGTAFWKACQDCEEILKLLGVPVVRAKAEGEALCAILNQKGIVDGVISNDGDCFLFGAKVLYTKFSIENLQQSQVMRYDATKLYARVSHDSEGEKDESEELRNGQDDTSAITKLSRDDLIAFALLTGSDLAGDGLPKVGYKKAIRFIRKCQLDYPLSEETATLDEIKSWGGASTKLDDVRFLDDFRLGDGAPKARCCSVCTHPGDKRQHEKHGCELCGTEPGEPCFDVSQEDVFRKYLKSKALQMMPKFDPAQVLEAYMKPNDNQIPFSLSGVSSKTLQMTPPRLTDMLSSSLVVKGRCLAGSREYITQSLSRLLARTDLFRYKTRKEGTSATTRGLSKEAPIPLRITKALVRNRLPCYEVQWKVNATITDAHGNAVDGYEFSTVESQALMETSHPSIIADFDNMQEELEKQGDAEACRRQNFVQNLLRIGGASDPNQINSQPRKRELKKRSEFFEKPRSQRVKFNKYKVVPSTGVYEGDDARNLKQLVRRNPEAAQDVGELFLSSFKNCCSHGEIGDGEESFSDSHQIKKLARERDPKKRTEFFEKQRLQRATFKKHKAVPFTGVHESDDVRNLKQLVGIKKKPPQEIEFDISSVEDNNFHDEISDGVKFFLAPPNSQHEQFYVDDSTGRAPSERELFATPHFHCSGASATLQTSKFEKTLPISNHMRSMNMLKKSNRDLFGSPCYCDTLKNLPQLSRNSDDIVSSSDDEIDKACYNASHNVGRNLEAPERFAHFCTSEKYEHPQVLPRTPGRIVVCDMGIEITMTPILSRR